MKLRKQNKIIEIAITDYNATSFTVKLEMSPQEKVDKTKLDTSDVLLIPNEEKKESRIKKSAVKSGSNKL
ncbi:hypothetical protein F9K33_04625 [bacterium]|nr:MAG: hypothetical protein F9K33_04625 [bacterium]